MTNKIVYFGLALYTLSIVLSTSSVDAERVEIVYHLWYNPKPHEDDPSLPGATFHTLSVENQTTFYKVMEKAAIEKPWEYSFEYVQYPFGKFITSIGGVSQVEEESIYWMIYKLQDTPNPNNPPSDDFLTPVGVESIQVDDQEIYLFWRKKTNPTKVMDHLKK